MMRDNFDESQDITVVIPLFNKVDTIVRALQSILDQSKQPREVIVINDGSTDSGEILVSQFEGLNINLINQENKGVSYTRNKAVDLAKYKYIAFLDADDYWMPGYIEEFFTLKYKYPESDIFVASPILKYANGNLKESVPLIASFEDGIVRDYFLQASINGPIIYTPALIVSKEIILKAGGFKEGIDSGEDILLWAKIIQYSPLMATNKQLVIIEIPASVNERKGRVHLEDDVVLRELKGLVTPDNTNSLHAYLSYWSEMRTVIFIQEGNRRAAFISWFRIILFNYKRRRGWLLLPFLFLPKSAFDIALKVRKL